MGWASHDIVMTPPADHRDDPLKPVPATGPGRLVLLCDPVLADPAMVDPGRQMDLLRRLGLVDPSRSDGETGSLQLDFGGVAVTMMQSDEPRAVLPAIIAADDVPFAPTVVTGASTIITLELADDTNDRAAAVQRLCALAALIGPLAGARHLYWQPARLWTSAEALADAVVAMEATGLPPILHLIGFATPPNPPPGRELTSTRGLDWFAGFELLVESPADMPKQEVVRRAARLAIDSLLNGDPGGPVNLPGLTAGERVVIKPLQRQDGQLVLPVLISGWHHH